MQRILRAVAVACAAFALLPGAALADPPDPAPGDPATTPVPPSPAPWPDTGNEIIGGSAVPITAVPWQVSLQIQRSDTLYLCGGSLIASRWVLTAGHCVAGVAPSAIRVGSGRSDLFAPAPGGGSGVQQVVLHPDYAVHYEVPFRDVALLELDKRLPGAEVIRPWRDADGVAEGERAIISGWGRTHPAGPATNILRAAAISVLGAEACAGYRGLFIARIMLCGGRADGGAGVCHGDSGGPLAVRTRAGWRLAGVTSWGIGCAGADFPGVFTWVATFHPWIRLELSGGVSRPTRPRHVLTSARDGAAVLAWEKPRWHGGSGTRDYAIDYRLVGTTTWERHRDAYSAVTRARLDVLRNGRTYEVRVAGRNTALRGVWSTVVEVTPRA